MKTTVNIFRLVCRSSFCYGRTFLVGLTPNTTLIPASFTYSKWNMVDICGLEFHLLYVHAPQFFFEIPPCAKDVIFFTEFVVLAKIYLSMKQKRFSEKGFALGGQFYCVHIYFLFENS